MKFYDVWEGSFPWSAVRTYPAESLCQVYTALSVKIMQKVEVLLIGELYLLYGVGERVVFVSRGGHFRGGVPPSGRVSSRPHPFAKRDENAAFFNSIVFIRDWS